MKIILGLIMLLIFFITLFVGNIYGGLIRHPDLSLEYYFSLNKFLLSLSAAFVFTGIFIFLSPVFKNIILLKKIIVRLAIINSLLCCILPFLIYALNSQAQAIIIYSYYSWAVFIIGLMLLSVALFFNDFKSNGKV